MPNVISKSREEMRFKKSRPFSKIAVGLIKKRKPAFIASAFILLLFIGILVFYYKRLLVSIIVSMILFFLGAISCPLSRKFFSTIHIGFDFIPFASILFFYKFGFATGMLAAIGMTVLTGVLCTNLGIRSFIEILAYVIVGAGALLININPFVNGIILVVVYNTATHLSRLQSATHLAPA